MKPWEGSLMDPGILLICGEFRLLVNALARLVKKKKCQDRKCLLSPGCLWQA